MVLWRVEQQAAGERGRAIAPGQVVMVVKERLGATESVVHGESRANNQKMKQPRREKGVTGVRNDFLIGKVRRMRVISEKGRDRRGPGGWSQPQDWGDRGKDVDDGQIGMETGLSPIILLKGTRRGQQ